VAVSALAGGLRFLDDGAAGTSDITSLRSTQTASAVQGGTDGLPLFMDGTDAQVLYSGSLDGAGQKTGFAARIGVNRAVIADSETLVKKSATADIGDASRPLALIDRLSSAEMAFSPATGIGPARAPFTGSVMEFARLVVADQTGKAENAKQAKTSQDVVKASVETRLTAKTGVDIDTELTKLIALQNSFAANARIVQAAQELFDRLMQI
jgi:flagellar hook-associated protein 1 FlgK